MRFAMLHDATLRRGKMVNSDQCIHTYRREHQLGLVGVRRLNLFLQLFNIEQTET